MRFLVAVLLVVSLAACAARRGAGPQGEAPQGDPVADVPGRRLYDQGVVLARMGDLTRAEQYLAVSIERGMAERQVLPQLLAVCVAASRFRAAVEYASPYLQRHPGDWHLRYLLAAIHAGLGETREARRHLETVLSQREAHAHAHYLLGSLLRDHANDPVAADAHFRRYLELEPEGNHAEEARAALLRTIPGEPTP